MTHWTAYLKEMSLTSMLATLYLSPFEEIDEEGGPEGCRYSPYGEFHRGSNRPGNGIRTNQEACSHERRGRDEKAMIGAKKHPNGMGNDESYETDKAAMAHGGTDHKRCRHQK